MKNRYIIRRDYQSGDVVLLDTISAANNSGIIAIFKDVFYPGIGSLCRDMLNKLDDSIDAIIIENTNKENNNNNKEIIL